MNEPAYGRNTYRASTIMPIELKTVARLLRSALSECGWHRTGGDDNLGTLSAELKRSSRERSLRFNEEFLLSLDWFKNGNRVQLNAAISDLAKSGNLADCRAKIQQIFSAIREKAEKLQSLPAEELDPRIYPLAEFADHTWFEKNGYYDGAKDPRRFQLGTYNGRIISMPANQTETHQLVCGPTRSGKTTGLFIPNLIERTGSSAIVTEATAGSEAPDLYSKTSGWRAQHGHKIYYFNPDDLRSDRVNPLDQIELNEMAGRQVSSVVKLIMQTTATQQHSGDQFWTDCERFLLRSLIWHAVGRRKEGNGHLGYVCELLQLDEGDLSMIMAESPMIKARQQFNSFISKGTDHTRNIVMQGLLQRLDLWTESMTVEMTRTTDINMKDLTEQLFTFYISMPGHKEELQPLAALLFNWIMQIVLEKQFTHPICLLLDEFTNFGFISKMDNKLTTIGHQKIPICMGIQDTTQLKTVYKEYAEIFRTQPGTRVFFRPRDGEIAKRISQDLGETTVVDYETSGSETISKKIKKQLLTHDQLLALQEECIVFLPPGRPAKIKFHHWRDYEHATKLPIPEKKKIVLPKTILFANDHNPGDDPEDETFDDAPDFVNHPDFDDDPDHTGEADPAEAAIDAAQQGEASGEHHSNSVTSDLKHQMACLALYIQDKLKEAADLSAHGRSTQAQVLYEQARQAELLQMQIKTQLNQMQQHQAQITELEENTDPLPQEPKADTNTNSNQDQSGKPNQNNNNNNPGSDKKDRRSRSDPWQLD